MGNKPGMNVYSNSTLNNQAKLEYDETPKKERYIIKSMLSELAAKIVVRTCPPRIY